MPRNWRNLVFKLSLPILSPALRACRPTQLYKIVIINNIICCHFLSPFVTIFHIFYILDIFCNLFHHWLFGLRFSIFLSFNFLARSGISSHLNIISMRAPTLPRSGNWRALLSALSTTLKETSSLFIPFCSSLFIMIMFQIYFVLSAGRLRNQWFKRVSRHNNVYVQTDIIRCKQRNLGRAANSVMASAKKEVKSIWS